MHRPKAGFGAPALAELIGGLDAVLADALSPEVGKRRGLFEPAEVTRLTANRAGYEDNALRTWTLVTPRCGSGCPWTLAYDIAC